VRTLAPPHAEECRANGEDPEGIAIPTRGGGCQLHALLRPPCRRSACARERPTRVVPRQPIHFPLADARPQASSVDGDSGEGARRTRVRARPRTQTLTARAARSSQDPNTGSDCGAGGSSSADRTHPSGRASERCICTAADGGPGDLEDARGDASSRMMRKQDKGGPFFWSRLESLTNLWPISIRVGQSGPPLSTPVPTLNWARCPISGGPSNCSGAAARADGNFSERKSSWPNECTREAACAADQSVVRGQFHRRERREGTLDDGRLADETGA